MIYVKGDGPGCVFVHLFGAQRHIDSKKEMGIDEHSRTKPAWL